MLDAADRDARRLDAAAFEAAIEPLRIELLNLQYDQRQRRVPVVILVAGTHREACNQLINALNDWLDAHYLRVHSFTRRQREARAHSPLLARFWACLPSRREIAVFYDGWAGELLVDRLLGDCDAAGFARRLAHICAFERQLAADGALVLKFWLHAGEGELRQQLAPARRTFWLLEEDVLHALHHPRRTARHASRLLEGSDTEAAPWHLIWADDPQVRLLRAAHILRDALAGHLAAPAAVPAPVAWPAARDPLAALDLSQRCDPADYPGLLEHWQDRLNLLSRRAQQRGQNSVVLLEGWDAAGKGGCIRRMTHAMPAQCYQVEPIAAPTPEELEHHYLWRFWQRLPRAGRMLILDRSWYGRVLVERVEGLAEPAAWQRAYGEINDFEQQLAEAGVPLVKCWLHVSEAEQLRRFEARQAAPLKHHKITADDWRARSQRTAYQAAAADMFARTHSAWGPWRLIAADDKKHARIEVLRSVCAALEAALGD